jgi:addiction module HigA family antidote
MTTIAPTHPGEVLHRDFLATLGLTQHHLAISISVPPRRIKEIVHGERRITGGAVRLGQPGDASLTRVSSLPSR